MNHDFNMPLETPSLHFAFMDAHLLVALFAVAALGSTFLWRSRQSRRTHGFPLPPGPRGIPIIGNVFNMPQKDEFEVATRWGEKYGDLVYVEIFGKSFLFVNSYEAATDLLEKRGNIYSGRPQTTMLELEGWTQWFIPLMSDGVILQEFKQLFNEFFQKSLVKDYYEVQIQSTNKLLVKLLEDPDSHRKHVKHWAAETIIKITYGYDIVEDDPTVEIANRGVRAITDAMLFFAVNVFPALRHLPTWFPGAGFHKIAQEGYKLSLAMYNVPFNEARRQMAEGKTTPSMMSKLLEAHGESDKSVIARTVAAAYAAGGDTTVAALLTFILAAVLYPDTMKKGQEELDRVVGKNSLPAFEDRARLPYVEAICSESLRWQTVAPVGVPHCVERDDVYKGYFIPAGTTVFPNAWAMFRDPKRYTEPDKFVPERWLPSPGQEQPLHANKIAFGFGRRICPGRFFAGNSIFMAVASILAVFDIRKAVDEHGVPITPPEDFTTGMERRPKPFKCKITPRSEEAVALIRHASFSA